MSNLMYVLYSFFSICISGIFLLMTVRAIASWIPGMGESSRVMLFVYTVTEFFIAPVRNVVDRFSFARTFPIDISFLVTCFLLVLLQRFLYFGFSFFM